MKKLLLFFAVCLQVQLSYGQVSAWASTENGGNKAANAIDASLTTRWESVQGSDDQWFAVDLGKQLYVYTVNINWENAYGKIYKIQISDDKTFTTYTEIASITNSNGKLDTVMTNNTVKGRYVRLLGIKRATGYGYSIYDFKVSGTETLNQVAVTLDVPYVQYMQLQLTPTDLNANSVIIVQNTSKQVPLSFNEFANISLDLMDFRGDFYFDLWALKKGSTTDTIRGVPFLATAYNNMVIHVKLTPKVSTGNKFPVADAGMDQIIYSPQNSLVIDGSKSQDPDGTIVSYKWIQKSGPTTATLTNTTTSKLTASNLSLGDYGFSLTVTDNGGLVGTDEVVVSVKIPDQVDFQLNTPADKSMVTNTRRPTLTWNAYTGATNYEVYLNITRSDYAWYASGNLLDRYTKVGETSSNSFVVPIDLVDRWTYKWYVVATTPGGTKYSNKTQFGLYIPTIETENDGISIVNGCRDMNKNGTIEPFEDWHLTPEQRVDDIMSRLTEEEKFCQLFYGAEGSDVASPMAGFSFSYGVEGGMRATQYACAKTRMGIPTAFAGDKANGWKTSFPSQIGLAAMRDMNMVYQCGNMQRIEQKSFGFTGLLCPLAEVNTKVLYPRIQEGSGENADDAAAIIRAIVCGMQGGPEINPHSMMTTVKHWASQGAGGESVLQYDSVTIKYHMKPWIAAVEANACSAMPGYNTSKYLDPDNGANTSKKGIDYLRNTIKWTGFVVTDWLAANTAQSIASLGAGVDVMGGSPSTPTDRAALIAAIGIDRINESCKRIMNVKIRLGMFENPYADPTCTYTKADHHALVVSAAKKCITLLKNDGILPLKLTSGSEVVVAGPRATWAGQNQDPNVIWQSIYYDDPLVKNHLQAITERGSKDGLKVYRDDSTHLSPKAVVVVIGEQSYTHGTEWADKNPNIPDDQFNIIKGFHDRGVKVIVVINSPRPYVLTNVLDVSDAILLIYRGGTGIGEATAGLIFGDYLPTGRTPWQLPRSLSQLGSDDVNNMVEKWDLPYDIGATASERSLIRGYIDRGEAVPPIFGDPLFQYGYGLQDFGTTDTTPSSDFDLTAPSNNSNFSIGNIVFSWQASTDAESNIKYYELYIDNIKKVEVNGTTYTYPLFDSGAHTWSVKAVNGAGVVKASTSTFSFNATSTTGLASSLIDESNDIQVYPNPFNDKIKISIKENKGLNQFRIIDMTGRTILNKNMVGQSVEIDLSAYSSGLYYLLVDGSNGHKISKLVKR